MFNKLNLSDNILQALESKAFVVPTEIQTKCIPLIAEGKDVVGRSQTGSGKTFAFGLPAIDKINTELKGIECIIICPTRELALQVTDELRKITENKPGCKVVPVYGGADITRQIKALKQSKIVVGTPGRIMDHMRRHTLKLDKIKMVVLDEADEMLNMGFRADIESILKGIPAKHQTVMFSATMPPAIKAITKEYMVEPEYVELGALNSTLDEINQTYVKVARNGKKTALIEIFRKTSPNRAIVFCNTKRMVDEINKLLNVSGFKALALHGDMRQGERKRVMTSIKKHEVSILVATDVAARGIDINDVDYVFNFDIPNDVEYYIHRIGRTARAGKSGKAITIVNTKEQLRLINDFKVKTSSKITEDSLSATLDDYDVKLKEVKPLAQRSSSKNETNKNSARPNRNKNSASFKESENKGEKKRKYFKEGEKKSSKKPNYSQSKSQNTKTGKSFHSSHKTSRKGKYTSSNISA